MIEQKSNSINSADDVAEYSGLDATQLKKAVGVWGFGFEPEQYGILNDMFDDWKSRVVIDGKTRETLVKGTVYYQVTDEPCIEG